MGAVRPDAVMVPRRAVLQGAKSHYVWVIDKDGKARERAVEVGEWHGDDWFINQGLLAGERVVVDGAIRVAPGGALKVVEKSATGLAGAEAGANEKTDGNGSTGSGSAASGPGKSTDKPR
jgi:membrane fusion protein (multidrug efflux system)